MNKKAYFLPAIKALAKRRSAQVAGADIVGSALNIGGRVANKTGIKRAPSAIDSNFLLGFPATQLFGDLVRGNNKYKPFTGISWGPKAREIELHVAK